MEKKCSCCKQVKSLDCFYKSKERHKYGVHSICKECFSKHSKKRYWADIEKSRAKLRIRSKRNRLSLKGRMMEYKQGARVRNIEWRLSLEEFKMFWQKPCYYCGDEIKTIGIDRIDSGQGYTLGNLVSCCKTCNYAKGKMTKEEYANHCRKVVDYLF